MPAAGKQPSSRRFVGLVVAVISPRPGPHVEHEKGKAENRYAEQKKSARPGGPTRGWQPVS
jgi:hypothetical protein